jgi:Skp family chaperone for outer membrane proteins
VTVAKRDNYDLVVSESVLYASEKIDITQKVLQELKLLGDN